MFVIVLIFNLLICDSSQELTKKQTLIHSLSTKIFTLKFINGLNSNDYLDVNLQYSNTLITSISEFVIKKQKPKMTNFLINVHQEILNRFYINTKASIYYFLNMTNLNSIVNQQNTTFRQNTRVDNISYTFKHLTQSGFIPEVKRITGTFINSIYKLGDYANQQIQQNPRLMLRLLLETISLVPQVDALGVTIGGESVSFGATTPAVIIQSALLGLTMRDIQDNLNTLYNQYNTKAFPTPKPLLNNHNKNIKI